MSRPAIMASAIMPLPIKDNVMSWSMFCSLVLCFLQAMPAHHLA
jgi:hypothetical protein